MMLGMGQTATPATVTAPPSSLDLYMAGLQSWGSPTMAFSALGATLSNASAAFSGSILPATLGLWTPPLVLAVIAFGAMSSRRRR